MVKKKGKSASFDAMVKVFIQRHKIPTTKDLEQLVHRIDRLEKTIRAFLNGKGGNLPEVTANNRQKMSVTASDIVLETIGKFKDGAGIPEVREKTGFGDKKLRNIIYRLHSIGKIRRISRGKYIVS